MNKRVTYKQALTHLRSLCVSMVLTENSENTYAKVKSTFIGGFKRIHGGISPTDNQVNHYMDAVYAKAGRLSSLNFKPRGPMPVLHKTEMRCF